MKKSEILKSFTLKKIDDSTVFINSKDFNFSYTKADTIVKDEYKGQYRYFGGLQCDYEKGSLDYALLEGWLIDIAEKIIKT